MSAADTIAADLIGDRPYRLMIGTDRCEAESGATFAVTNPATGAELTRVPDAGGPEIAAAIEAAASIQPAWAARPAPERAALLRAVAQAMIDNQERLATVMTLEQGKPLAESRGEIAYAASFLRWFAGEAERTYGRTVPSSAANKRIVVLRQPIGVAALITPWNFPAAMLARKVAPALAAGCCVVAKPAEQTPLTALELGALFRKAGLPPGALNLITTSRPAEFAEAVFADDRVRAISFTGSTEVGKRLIAQSAAGVKRLGLELGGNAPFIVFADADLPAAVEGAVASKFRNAGQTCVCANRILVERPIYERFAAAFGAEIARLRVGSGLDPATAIGPLIDGAALEKVRSHVADAVAGGARVLRGGGLAEGLAPGMRGAFWQPTLLADVDQSMLVAREETFGPVAPLMPFDGEDEALELANATPYGLAAYFYTQNIGRVWRMAEGLQYGIIGANDALPSTAQAPFGGVKQSGLGREGGTEGMDEYLDTKYISLGI